MEINIEAFVNPAPLKTPFKTCWTPNNPKLGDMILMNKDASLITSGSFGMKKVVIVSAKKNINNPIAVNPKNAI